MATLDSLFEQFLRERRYLKNVSPRTCEWYATAWHTFLATQAPGLASTDIATGQLLTRQHLSSFVVALRDRGVKPVTCNTWLRALNAYCRWLAAEGVLRDPVRLQPMKLEKRFVPTLDEHALRALLAFKPAGFAQWRVVTAVATILDTGCRIAEILDARERDFDFENLLLTVVGKGDKQRIVPFGFELRKRLFRFGQLKAKQGIRGEWMFGCKDGGRWEHRNALRSYYLLLERLGLPRSGFHKLRHTFATQYLKAGGDVVRLSKVLGHTEVSTTMKYEHLLTADLQAPHERLSILNRIH